MIVEEEFCDILSSLGVSCFCIDLEGKIRRVNQVWLQLYGYKSSDEVVGKHLKSTLAKEDVNKAQQFIENLLMKGTAKTAEFTLRFKDGSVGYYKLFADPVLNNGKIMGAKGFVIDSAELKRSEKAEEEKDRLLTALETSREAICITSSEGKIVFINDAMNELFGYKAGELIGKYPAILIAGPAPEAITEKTINIVKKKGHWKGEIYNKKKDGTEFITSATISAVKNKSGKILNYISTRHCVTEQKETEAKYRALAESAMDGIYIISTNTGFEYVNPAFERIVGYGSNELCNKNFNFFDLIYPEDKNLVRERKEARTRGCNLPHRYEFRILTKKGDIKYVEANTVSLSGFKGKVLGIIRDITDRKKIENELRHEKEFAQSLIETSQVIILVLDNNGRIVHINPYVEEISGFRLKEVKGKDWFSTFLAKSDRKLARSVFNSAIKGIQTRGKLNPIITKNGSKREIEWYDKTIKDNQGAIVGLISVGHDVTEQKLAELRLKEHKQMLESSRNEIRNFSRQILIIREEEKKRLSTSLHDELGDCAIGLSSSLAEIEEEIKKKNFKKAQKNIEKTKDLLQGTVSKLKKIAIDLRPPGLEVMGLIDVLKELIKDTEKKSNLHIRFQTNMTNEKINDNISIALYRIIQECFTNIIKHAKAKRATLSLYSRNSTINVKIQDDGVGFNLDKKLDEDGIHFGIIGMKEMAESLEGTLDIKSKPGNGTKISLLFPNTKLKQCL